MRDQQEEGDQQLGEDQMMEQVDEKSPVEENKEQDKRNQN